MLISIVIPVFNAQQTVGPLVESILGDPDRQFDVEVVLVNDSSTDRSDEVCGRLAASHPGRVRYFLLSKNVGEHNAVMAGLNQARGDYAVIMDDDFQNPVREVRKLVQAAREGGHDVVYSYYDEKKHSLFRNLGSWFNDRVANVMLRKPRDLYLSSFKIINRFLIDEITRYDLPFPYVDGLILRTTDSIGKIKVEHESRRQGRSGYTLHKLVRLWLNMFTNFSILPLRAAILLGFAFSILGIGLGIYTLVEKFLNPNLPVGWAALLVTLSMFSGVQLIALGMIGEYLGRVFLSQNKKPQYTIRKRVDST